MFCWDTEKYSIYQPHGLPTDLNLSFNHELSMLINEHILEKAFSFLPYKSALFLLLQGKSTQILVMSFFSMKMSNMDDTKTSGHLHRMLR